MDDTAQVLQNSTRGTTFAQQKLDDGDEILDEIRRR